MREFLAADDPRVRSYDFHNQEVIDRGRIRRLQPVLDAAAQRMAGALSGHLRQPAHISVVGTPEQVIWDEARGAIEDPTFIAAAAMVGLDGRLVLHFPVELGLFLVDVQLSGPGKEQPKRLELTDLEFSLLGTIADDMFSAFQSAIEVFFELGIAAVQKLRSSIYVRMGRPGETCLQVNMSLAVAEAPVRALTLYWPLTALHPILEAFDRLQREDERDRLQRSANVERRLLHLPVEVQVSYPPVQLTASEVLGLRVGDVIPMNMDKDDDRPNLDVIAGGQCIAKAVHVAHGKRLACTIASLKVEGT